MPAGALTLGAPEGADRNYRVLLAEADGRPSPAPAVPVGLEVPVPNGACPAWVHDQYAAEGHDGRTYRSWHPQLDPVHWCAFGHEHGSDPGPIGYAPTFEYVAAHRPQSEMHEGFKGFAIEGDGVDWYGVRCAHRRAAGRAVLQGRLRTEQGAHPAPRRPP